MMEITLSQRFGAIAGKFVRFLGVGLVATAIQYLLLGVLVELFSLRPVIASAVSFAVSAVGNYFLNYYFTFSSTVDHRRAMGRFAIVAICGLGLNTVLMYALIDWLSLHYLLSQVVTTGIVLVWNFVVHKLWTYKGV